MPSQKTEDFLYALAKALEFYGGVPRIVVPDNLKAAVIRSDRYEPVLSKAMDDMGNHYGFVTIHPHRQQGLQPELVQLLFFDKF